MVNGYKGPVRDVPKKILLSNKMAYPVYRAWHDGAFSSRDLLSGWPAEFTAGGDKICLMERPNSGVRGPSEKFYGANGSPEFAAIIWRLHSRVSFPPPETLLFLNTNWPRKKTEKILPTMNWTMLTRLIFKATCTFPHSCEPHAPSSTLFSP